MCNDGDQFQMEYQTLEPSSSTFRRRRRTWSFHVVVLQRTVQKCTNIYNARAQLLFCSLNLLPDFLVAVVIVVGSFSKPRRRRQREPQQTKGLMSKTMVLHVRFESWYISLPSSAKQQREMTKFYVFWRTWTTMAYFSYLLLQPNAIRARFSWAYL